MSRADEPSMFARVGDEGLLARGRPVVVLLSGGRDSVCLLDLAVRISGPGAVFALHVNYGLRDGAGADERHCVALCERAGVPLEVRRPRAPRGGNRQAWAREQRYAAAAELARARAADIAAGHTATDQVETILYRLASSPSRRALLGMSRREGGLIRPLLAFTREQTAAYCRERGLSWREDESNEDLGYARNRIRRVLVPALRDVHPGAHENVLALAEWLRDEAAVLDLLVTQLLGDAEQIALSRLRELPVAMQRLLVQRLADQATGGPAPGAARRAQEIASLSERGTAELHLGDGLRAIAEYGVLRFARVTAGAPVPGVPALDPVALAVPGSVTFGQREVRCELGPPAKGPGILDSEAVGAELIVRAWRPGDRMSPLGLRGTKSLQDLFTARRLPRAQRGRVAVVEARGEIAWVAGVATSERFKVTSATRRTARLSVREPPP